MPKLALAFAVVFTAGNYAFEDGALDFCRAVADVAKGPRQCVAGHSRGGGGSRLLRGEAEVVMRKCEIRRRSARGRFKNSTPTAVSPVLRTMHWMWSEGSRGPM